MKKYFIISFIILAGTKLFSQTKNSIQIDINYGFNLNPSADYFFETNNPPNGYTFYDKSTAGTISGIEVKFPVSKTWSLGLAYDQSIHRRSVSFMPSNIPIFIDDFTIRNYYNYYQLVVQKDFSKKNHIISISTGLYYQRVAWQNIGASTTGISIEERSFKNDRLEDAGALLGFQYTRKIDTHFYLGLRSRIYSTISAGASIDGISLVPVLSYHF